MSWNFTPNCIVNIFINVDAAVPPTGAADYAEGVAQMLLPIKNAPLIFATGANKIPQTFRLVIPGAPFFITTTQILPNPDTSTQSIVEFVDLVRAEAVGYWRIVDVSLDMSYDPASGLATFENIFLAITPIDAF